MRKLKIYLDTSVINFLFADDAPDFKKVTIEFFENCVKTGRYDVYVSDVVVKEINETKDESKRMQLLEVIKKHKFHILTLDKEVNELAKLYIKENILPKRKLDDARHIAMCTCNQMDVLLSWNFRHLANLNKQIKVKIVNEREGYFYPLTLTNPMEVIYDENN